MAKLELRRDDASEGERARIWWTAADTLAATLRLLHPILPFVTEEIWGELQAREPALTGGEPLLIRAQWPRAGQPDAMADGQVADLIELVRGVRNLRSAAGVPAGDWIPLALAPADGAAARGLDTALRFLEPMARARPIAVRTGETAPAGAAATTSGLGAAWLERQAAADTGREAYLRQGIARLETLLGDARFVERAPAAVVQRERERLEELRSQLAGLTG
jgi:valyl-tRNA synthetase